MNKILKNIHLLFWGFTLFFLIYGIYVHVKIEDSALDFNIHDTMFVISAIYVIAFQALLFLIFGFAYYVFYNTDRYKPINLLSVVHIVLTIVGLSVLFFTPDFEYKLPVESTTDILENLKGSRNNNNIKAFSGLGVFIAQKLFLVNLFVAIFRK